MLICICSFSMNAFAQECNLSVDAGPDRHFCEPVTLSPLYSGESQCTEIIKYYKLHNVDPTCENVNGTGVFFQKPEGCNGHHIPWKAEDLKLLEYSNGTAKIIGTISNDGNIGHVDIDLSAKNQNGNTWNASCYTNNLGSNQHFYQNFSGTITINGTVYTIRLKSLNQHFILADGAGNQGNGFGLGAWTGGSFGGCTEIFTNLQELPIPNELSNTTIEWTGPNGFTSTNEDITVDVPGTYTFTVTDCAGCTQSDQVTLTATNLSLDLGPDRPCTGEGIQLTANATGASACREIAKYYQIVDSDPVCEGITGTGVVFQRGEEGEHCQGDHIPWQAGDNLFFTEFNDGTAQITGTITNNGQIGFVNIYFTNRQTVGQTWDNECYLGPLGSERTFYQNFEGTITINGTAYTIEQKSTGKDIVIANGANNQDDQYSFGIWSSGTFGTCTEWFGTLIQKETPHPNNSPSYQWTGPGISTNDQTITVTEPGIYTVTFTDCNGCTVQDEIEITPCSVVIGDFVWFDENQNGLQDAGEAGVPNVMVRLISAGPDGAFHTADDMIVDTRATGANGQYLFEDIDAGEYCIEIMESSIPEGYQFTNQNAGNDALDSDADATGKIDAFTIVAGQEDDLTFDAGIFLIPPQSVNIGNFVWFDDNQDGLQDAGEAGVPNIIVRLISAGPDGTFHTADDMIVGTEITDDNGEYLFADIEAGEYCIEFVETSVPAGYQFTNQNTGNDALDSDVDATGKIDAFTIVEGQEDDLTFDAGIFLIPPQSAGLGDYTWIDEDRDGLQGANEPALANVTVNLFYVEDKTVVINTAITDENGYYEFTNLDPEREYLVQFDVSSVEVDGLFFITNVGNGASIGNPTDSDADPVTGCTDAIDLEPGEFDSSIDAGFFCVSCVLDIQARLQGASNSDGGLMNDDLRTSQMIPTNQPFNDAKFNYDGTELLKQTALADNAENSIIDWVLIEIRDNEQEIVKRTAGLMQRDGDIVDTDGVSKIYVGDLSGDYYICLGHRNHMGVMTESPITIDNGATVDFTSIDVETFGDHAQNIVNGKCEMWVGDISGDGQIIFQGVNNDPNSVFFEILSDPANTNSQINFIKSGYSRSDVDLNNKVIYQGADNDNNAIFFNVLFHPGNTNLSPNYIVKEQIPK